jgi:predicted regulator of Ras-like GTPase activity (Roadblock/LC7/MglB family)
MATTPDTRLDTRTVTAIFDDAAACQRAVAWLKNIGLRDAQIQQTLNPTKDKPTLKEPFPTRPKRRGFMDSIVDFIFPDDGAAAEGQAGAGPRSVTVTEVTPALYDRVVAILGDEGKVRLGTGRADIAGTSQIKGFIGACLVDTDSGLMLASEGGGEGGAKLDFNLVAALNSDTVRAKQTAVEQLGLGQRIEDILITLDKQVHLIRPLESNRSMFVYVALDKATSNLGMARLQLKHLESGMAP